MEQSALSLAGFLRLHRIDPQQQLQQQQQYPRLRIREHEMLKQLFDVFGLHRFID